jgi:anti-anti-sigma factor
VLLASNERRILLDLAQLSDIDAAGVGELVRAFNTLKAAGGVLRITHANPHVRQLLRVAGVLGLLSGDTEGDIDLYGGGSLRQADGHVRHRADLQSQSR